MNDCSLMLSEPSFNYMYIITKIITCKPVLRGERKSGFIREVTS